MIAIEDEKRCIGQSLKGDHEAFETLVKNHQDMIFSLAFRMTGSMADAEDLAQETFVQAYQQLGNFRGESKFSSWLYRIAANRCLNWKKKISRRAEVDADWMQSLENAGEPDAKLSAQVQEALMKLDPKQRAAIVLTVYEEMSHAETARALGCSETTVSWRIFSARKKLKRWLKLN